ncbi:MAG: antitoxin VapB family protein [archaeon]
MITTIQLDKSVKEKLEALKVHPRETFNDLILRILSNNSLETASRESLIATIEVMSDPEAMREIREALSEEGGTPIEDVERELGL